ncbi:MAG TPA: GreA/GreB family elongation factor [Cytophagales bacterium]|nr:GreA/GreB family elongation factor [Cytophagales bacterium]
MNTTEIIITKGDKKKLLNVLNKKEVGRVDPFENMILVRNKIKTAQLVDPENVPPSVVTMNSKVKIKNLSVGKTMSLTLVYPEKTDVENQRISIFSPIGASMLGYSQGDSFIWSGRRGSAKFVIEEVEYQPESAGDFHL